MMNGWILHSPTLAEASEMRFQVSYSEVSGVRSSLAS